MKMNLRCLAVSLFLLSISLPATLMADGNPNGPPPPIVQLPTPLPPDGNPNGPPPKVIMRVMVR